MVSINRISSVLSKVTLIKLKSEKTLCMLASKSEENMQEFMP